MKFKQYVAYVTHANGDRCLEYAHEDYERLVGMIEAEVYADPNYFKNVIRIDVELHEDVATYEIKPVTKLEMVRVE